MLWMKWPVERKINPRRKKMSAQLPNAWERGSHRVSRPENRELIAVKLTYCMHMHVHQSIIVILRGLVFRSSSLSLPPVIDRRWLIISLLFQVSFLFLLFPHLPSSLTKHHQARLTCDKATCGKTAPKEGSHTLHDVGGEGAARRPWRDRHQPGVFGPSNAAC